MSKILTSADGSIRLTVVGKINLTSKPKHKFVPRSGGYRLGEVWPK